MSSSEGAQYDPGPGGGAALNRGARGLAQKIKDWTDARIAAAIAGRSGLTSLKINGAQIGLRQHLDVQMTGATAEDHPELDLVRAILPAGGGGGGGGGSGWSLVERLTVTALTDTLAFASIPPSGDSLMLVSRGSVVVGSGQSGANYGLLLNGDLPTDPPRYRYLYTEVEGYPSPIPGSHYTTAHDSFGNIGNFGASLSGATADDGGGVSICYLPGFAAARPITALSQSHTYHQALTSFSGAQIFQGTYTFTYDGDGPVTALSVHCGNGGRFAVGTTFALYVLNGTGGGGGAASLPRCAAFFYNQDVSLNVPSNSITTVPLDYDDFDPDGWHDEAALSPNIIVPAEGDYEISARFVWSTVGGTTFNSGTYRRLVVQCPGGVYVSSSSATDAPHPSNLWAVQSQYLTFAAHLPANCHVYMTVEHDADGPMTCPRGQEFPMLLVKKIG